jgi:hypothetical protein
MLKGTKSPWGAGHTLRAPSWTSRSIDLLLTAVGGHLTPTEASFAISSWDAAMSR